MLASVGDPDRPDRPGGTTTHPGISVVIPAYRRREYLPEAWRSVQSSEGGLGSCEIVVVKDFEEPTLDALRTDRVTTIAYGSRNYGSTIARAVRACRGDVVAFLEDDDRFLPTKLARLNRVFGEVPGMAFYHNDYREIDGHGAPLPASSQRRAIDRRVAGRPLEWYSGEAKLAEFDRLSDSVPSAHMSCIALSRRALEPVLPYLERVPIGVDFFLFFAGLACEGAIAIDPEKLTEYRHHPANSSRALSFDPGWYGELREGSRAMAASTRAMLAGLGRPDLLPRLEAELAAHAVYVATAAPRPERRSVVQALAGMLRDPMAFRGTERRLLFLRAGLFVAEPSWAVRLLRPRRAPTSVDRPKAP